MSGSAERGLLERATVALERQEKAFERQEKALGGMMQRWDESDARAEERHRRLLERQERSERLFVSALSDIDASIQSNTERLDDMADAIRANTRAVLAVLNGLEPRSG
jgi:flavin-dependent dehydrogenase